MASGSRMAQALRKSQAMGPSVRNLINQYKLDPNQISSTGPHQTLLKGDVLSYLKDHRPANDTHLAGAQSSPSAAYDSAWTSPLSAPKPATSRTSQSRSIVESNTRYPRRTLTELEIEVINSGGILEKPTAKPNVMNGAKKR